jgi:hypothetical protein
MPGQLYNELARLLLIATDLIEYAKIIAQRNPQLIMLDVMPDEDEDGRSDQRIIVSMSCVLMLIRHEASYLLKNSYDPVLHKLYGAFRKSYMAFSDFLRDQFIRSRIDSAGVMNNHAGKKKGWGRKTRCEHWGDWVERMVCDSFVPQHDWYQYDTLEWQNLVKDCNVDAPSKLCEYKVRYFFRTYFFLALDCSPPVVEAVDITLFHLTKN